VHPSAVFLEGGLANRAAIDVALTEHRPDAVMHFASRTLVGESMQKPFLYLGDNVRTGLNLFQSIVEHGVKRICFSGGYLLRHGGRPSRENKHRRKCARQAHNLSRFSRKAFPITDTELNAIAAPAIIGLKRIPKNG